MKFKPHQTLDILKPYLPDNPIVVEAGAFTGSDSIRMANYWPKAMIHSFEPVSELFVALQSKTIAYENIECYNLALSNKNGYESLYLSVKPDKNNRITQASSLLAPTASLEQTRISFPKTIPIQTITLDSWAQKNEIAHIDLLWLDTQGHELAILKSSPAILQKTKAVHVEVATIERYHKQPLYAEVKSWLEENGFKELGQDFDFKKRQFGNAVFLRSA